MLVEDRKRHVQPARGGSGFKVSRSGFRNRGFAFRVSHSGSRNLGFGFRVSCFAFRVLGFGFLVFGFEFRVSGFGLRVSGSWFQISGFGFWVHPNLPGACTMNATKCECLGSGLAVRTHLPVKRSSLHRRWPERTHTMSRPQSRPKRVS